MMNHTPAVALVVLLSMLASRAFAQEQDNNTLPVTALPLSAEPPRIAFAALARERGPNPQKGGSDMQVTLWEIQPGRVNQPAVRRHVLGRSHWNAAPLLDSPTVLRWQVPGNVRGYDVKILRVDYTKFELHELMSVRQAHAFGRSGTNVFLDTSQGQCVLDVTTGVRTDCEPEIRPLKLRGDDWLVAINGLLGRFDPSKNMVVRRYDAIRVADNADISQVHWDGGRFAVAWGAFVDASGKTVHMLDYGKPAIVYRELCIWNLQVGTERKLRVRVQARGGSGIGVIPTAMHTELNGPMFRYTERVPADANRELSAFDWERDTQWVTIEIATGNELMRELSKAHTPVVISPADEIGVPEYLRELFVQSPIRAWGAEQKLAYAFLVHSGIDAKLPPRGVRKLGAVCRSPDGEQMLVLHQGQFYHCNLKTKVLKQFAAPEALAKANVKLHAVVVRL
jgi:hypothetical protein